MKAVAEEVRESGRRGPESGAIAGNGHRQNRETLRNMLEAQSQALEQQKRTVDALIEKLRAAADGRRPSPPKTPVTVLPT